MKVAIPFEVGQVSTKDIKFSEWVKLVVAIPFEVGQVSTRCKDDGKKRSSERVSQSLLK